MYTTEQASDVITVRMDTVREGWEQWFLLMADVHWDNPHCRRDLFHRHMSQAKERNAGVMIFGDFFCLMQGRGDPRGNKDSIRPEHNTGTYIDSVVDTAIVDLQPHIDNLVMVSPGNHETAILKHLETDVTKRLCKGVRCLYGGYSGFVRFMFSRNGSGALSHNLFYHHGAGGGGEVTKGVIGTNRRAVWLPDASIVCTGHIHESWIITLPRLRLSGSGKTYQDEQTHVQLGTYKDEFDLMGGYHIEKGRPPKPLGGAWLRFFYDGSQRSRVSYEVMRAK